MKLLIVDDEQITIKGILKGIQWTLLPFDEVFSALSVEQAKGIIENNPVDLMLCDIEMGNEGGIELLTWAREQQYDIECIFLTCHDEFHYAQKALQLQGMDYILKPMPYMELQEIIAKAVTKLEQKKESDILREYGRSQINHLKKEQEKEWQSNRQMIVEHVKEYIQTHLQENLTVELLASVVHVSSAHLFRIFKKEENMTIVEYVTKARLFYAQQMLKETDLPVSRVATSVGYDNYTYFTKVFKKYCGITPSEYHRLHRKKEQNTKKDSRKEEEENESGYCEKN